ncbi:Nif11-like leader peptide family natural product precursor [Synechococcus sp. BIOS-E4-1]|uniref:Nif11-like leader peptide family natural product precursor n=1 Tax=Synechococcus sp. BIOS-E4-1 TaxID=1400864 RepID=UPI0016481EA8|nr:Nif11-like leader peptide family natural product precursor [Synechococcus sp. BIOS-E4-1]
MTSPIEDLLAHLEANPEVRNAIITATTLEEATEIAENAGFKIDAKDLCNAHKDELLELSDEELEVIAGGKYTATPGQPPGTTQGCPGTAHTLDIAHGEKCGQSPLSSAP